MIRSRGEIHAPSFTRSFNPIFPVTRSPLRMLNRHNLDAIFSLAINHQIWKLVQLHASGSMNVPCPAIRCTGNSINCLVQFRRERHAEFHADLRVPPPSLCGFVNRIGMEINRRTLHPSSLG